MFDRNFNILAPTIPFTNHNGGNVTVVAPTNPADGLGMFFTQQYCDTAPSLNPVGPMSCGMTCQSTPCYRVSKISAYGYGTTNVTITGGTMGADIVTLTATFGPFVRSITIPGTIE
jgi:hypothetical protein